MPRSALRRLGPIAEDQWGLISSRQIAEAGVDADTAYRLVKETSLERVAHGVYRVAGAPQPDHIELRAAWIQLAPSTPVWQRGPEQGVVSHRSAAAVQSLGHLSADRHEFILPRRRQPSRRDVRIHVGLIAPGEWFSIQGLLVTRPARTAFDLVAEREDPGAVAQVIADSIRDVKDYPGRFAESLSPLAGRFGFRRGDGIALLGWLLELSGDPHWQDWMADVRRSRRASSDERSSGGSIR